MTKNITRSALCAKAIRQELKVIGVESKTISVKSRNYAGGNAVDLDCYDLHPRLAKKIEDIIQKYKALKYDHYQDISLYIEYEDKDLPRSNYVSLNNSLSQTTKEIIERYIDLRYPEDFKNPHSNERHYEINKLFRSVDFWDNKLPLVGHLVNLEKCLDVLKNQPCTLESFDELNDLEDRIEAALQVVKSLPILCVT